MSLQEVAIQRDYRSLVHDIAREFYIPLLSRAVFYDRAVGFFSSTILAQIAAGITGLRNNGGKIRLVASPHLSDEDIQAIQSGYKRREDVIASAIQNAMTEPKNDFEKEHLNILANLIADGVLDIKIAFTEKNGKMGMYHEKLGLIGDSQGNVVAFSGSMNESTTALTLNYEAIDVYCSWNPQDVERVADKKKAFESIWNDTEQGIKTIEFPSLKQDIIAKYKREVPDWTRPPVAPPAPEDIVPTVEPVPTQVEIPTYYPKRPAWFSVRQYQSDAIENWSKAGYRGIFDMATGTGKTLTALEAIRTISEAKENKLAVIVVVPYQHLVEQWVEDITAFNIKPIIGYSASAQRDWLRRLENAIRVQGVGVKGAEFFLFICTNATFTTPKVQQALAKLKSETLIVVDEAHNAGAPNFRKVLLDRYEYRLALSATVDRHNDEDGTGKLFEYFGEKCIEYSLDEAIEKDVLTQYYYYPIKTYLNATELDAYIELSREIAKCMVYNEKGKMVLSEKGKRIALKRARVVAGATDKLAKLKEVIKPFKDDKHLLVYCGATNITQDAYDYSDTEPKDIKQIEEVSNILGNELGMKTARFTSQEDMPTRKKLQEEFAEGKTLQALVAIKCLDEGVNIPAIKKAFILASTTNPKEYIQRRGRVLRKYDGKRYAEIYDFITLPRDLSKVSYQTEEQRKVDMSLIKREIERAEEFARLAMNVSEATKEIQEIKDAYAINDFEIKFDEEY